MPDALLRTVELTKSFTARRASLAGKKVKNLAVDRVSLTVGEGETLGLVGESGCGKSTLALTIMRLHEPTAGRIIFAGRDINGLGEAALKPVRRQMQMVFQDPLASLDPRLTVEQIICEPLDSPGAGARPVRRAPVARLLERVGLAASDMGRYPNEFSGGQQQRIGIARALALRPRLLICDEPVSALDVSVQAQILNLLRDLQDEFGLAYLFISHNIAVTAHMSRRIGVMYLGRVVEEGPAREIITAPRHPYTRALLAAVPEPDPSRREVGPVAEGDAAGVAGRPTGCAFRARCPAAAERCAAEEPRLRPVAEGRVAACHFA